MHAQLLCPAPVLTPRTRIVCPEVLSLLSGPCALPDLHAPSYLVLCSTPRAPRTCLSLSAYPRPLSVLAFSPCSLSPRPGPSAIPKPPALGDAARLTHSAPVPAAVPSGAPGCAQPADAAPPGCPPAGAEPASDLAAVAPTLAASQPNQQLIEGQAPMPATAEVSASSLRGEAWRVRVCNRRRIDRQGVRFHVAGGIAPEGGGL